MKNSLKTLPLLLVFLSSLFISTSAFAGWEDRTCIVTQNSESFPAMSYFTNDPKQYICDYDENTGFTIYRQIDLPIERIYHGT